MSSNDSRNDPPGAPVRALDPSERTPLDLDSFCVVLELHEETVCEWVDEGLLRPHGRARRDWAFPPEQLDRARRALRLQHDLGLNTASLPLVMDLLGEVQRLRRRVRQLEDRFFE
ncbi:hypothetical protein HFP89_04845 [Wenzhouxiangella sp. XN79A]|uniref:chaperone modulator CbpM n=1 Tax=Wenzhouxiangella sp. XN79A TaxID=2724193 RepID=UPI00144ABD78|nr:chaperone modulator CbpM [Wenzhouxiangella sp. XN79A]NKI34490.1 hypothetical protein [Wenzhouxiangella sp. XN79A]